MASEERARVGLAKIAAPTSKSIKGAAITQYAALCIRGAAPDHIEVLMITSRDSGRWVIPKGWPMKKKKPHRVAALEAWEEAGGVRKVKKRPIGYYTSVKVLGNGDGFQAIAQVHLLQVSEISSDYPDSGQRRRVWARPDEAAEMGKEPELKSLIRSVRSMSPAHH